MPLSDNYSVLSSAVRVASSGKLSYEARLRALVELIFRTFSLSSLAVYLVDEDRRHLTRKITDGADSAPSGCCIPFGEGVAGRCAQEKVPVTLEAALAVTEEWRRGGNWHLSLFLSWTRAVSTVSSPWARGSPAFSLMER